METPNQPNNNDSKHSALYKQAQNPGFWREQWHTIRLIGRLLRDPEVPLYLKLIPIAALVYLFVPIDLIPDIALGLGQLDDLTVLLLGAKTFTNLVPNHIVEQHRQAILESDTAGKVIDQLVEDKIIIEKDKTNF